MRLFELFMYVQVASDAFDSRCHLIRPARHKVFVVSPQKSGTTALGFELRQLGYKMTGWTPALGELVHENVSTVNRMVAENKSLSYGILYKYLHPLVQFAAQYDGANDYPLGHTFLDLRARMILFPEARFVWSDRDLLDVAESQYVWNSLGNVASTPPTQKWLQKRISELQALRRIAVTAHNQYPKRVLILQNFSRSTLLTFLGLRDSCSTTSEPIPDIAPRGIHIHGH